MNPDPAAFEKPGLSGRLRGAAMGMLAGTATGGVCAFGLEAAYRYLFYDYPEQDGAILLFWVFLLPGLGAGALVGSALGWRNASRRQDDVASPSGLRRLGWTALGTMVGGLLFGVAAFGLGVAYFSFFPKIPDEGGTGYALFLLILPAGITAGSICGALAGWHACASKAKRRLAKRSRAGLRGQATP